MDLVNRFVVILLALLIIFAAGLITLLAWAEGPDTVNSLGDFVGYLEDHVEDDGSRIILSLGSAVVALLALLVVFIELAPPEASTVPVRDVKAGNAVLTTEAVARRVQEEVARVPHVAQSKATVTGRGKGVEVALDLQVEQDSNLSATSEVACQVLKDVVTSQLGVELVSPPRLKLHFAESPRRVEAPAPDDSTKGQVLASAPGEAPAPESAADPPQTS